MSLPQWTTAIIETTVAGEDQLGIEGAAQMFFNFRLEPT